MIYAGRDREKGRDKVGGRYTERKREEIRRLNGASTQLYLPICGIWNEFKQNCSV